MTKIKNVLLIGHDFFPYFGSGDKNYWLGMVPTLSDHVGALCFLSINHVADPKSELNLDSGAVNIFNIKPLYIFTRLGSDSKPKNSKCATSFKKPIGTIVDAPLTFVVNILTIRRIILDENIDVIHFMDNFGFSARLLKLLFPRLRYSVTHLGMYTTSGIRGKYRALTSNKMDAVVCANRDMEAVLVESGCTSTNMISINWGFGSKNNYNVSLDASLNDQSISTVVWSGYTQQLGEKEFYLALEIAKEILQSTKKIQFLFLFKPECWNDKFQEHSISGIEIRTTSYEEFQSTLAQASCLFSPVARLNTVITPPLTWVEAMHLGVPVCTNLVPGVSTALGDVLSDYIADTKNDLSTQIMNLCENWNAEMSKQLADWSRDRYSIEKSALSYCSVWNDL